jgi:flagellar basal body rod protein FlgB
MTATTTRLVQIVPKALMTYQCRKVEKILKKLTADLNAVTDDTQMMEIVQKITEYNKARTRLNNELGRVN